MILPVFCNWAGLILCLVAGLFGVSATSFFVDERSHYWIGIFFVVAGLFSTAGSLCLSKKKKIRNHVMFIPVWVWGILATLLGGYCVYEAYTLQLP